MTKNKQIVNKQIWLNYYNGYLFDKGIITETERNKMKNLICSNGGASKERKNFINNGI